MKKIGLIGGTGYESSLIYYRELNSRLVAASGNTEFPEITLDSVNLYKIFRLIGEEKYAELTDYVNEKLQHLEQCGVDILALTAATMHIIYDTLAEGTSLPLISIPQAAAKYAVSKGYKRVGLLGTIFTMEKDYLSKAFTQSGIAVFTPEAADRQIVNDIIANELEFGIVKEVSTQRLLDIVKEMQANHKIDALILGCTELPLAISDTNSSVPCLDIMAIHIDELVKLAMQE